MGARASECDHLHDGHEEAERDDERRHEIEIRVEATDEGEAGQRRVVESIQLVELHPRDDNDREHGRALQLITAKQDTRVNLITEKNIGTFLRSKIIDQKIGSQEAGRTIVQVSRIITQPWSYEVLFESPRRALSNYILK